MGSHGHRAQLDNRAAVYLYSEQSCGVASAGLSRRGSQELAAYPSLKTRLTVYSLSILRGTYGDLTQHMPRAL
jgi:hypothetical protein